MLLVMFLFSILGNLLFGANDPANFENVERGMLSLFVFATLASWGNVAQINYFGCHLYHGGMYEAHVDVDARRRVAVFDERDPRRLDDLHGAARRRALELARERAEPRRPRGPEDDDVDL